MSSFHSIASIAIIFHNTLYCKRTYETTSIKLDKVFFLVFFYERKIVRTFKWLYFTGWFLVCLSLFFFTISLLVWKRLPLSVLLSLNNKSKLSNCILFSRMLIKVCMLLSLLQLAYGLTMCPDECACNTDIKGRLQIMCSKWNGIILSIFEFYNDVYLFPFKQRDLKRYQRRVWTQIYKY